MRCRENHQIHFLCKIALFENSQPPITMETTKILRWITMWDFFLLGWLCVINFCYIIFFFDSPEKAAVIRSVSLTSHLSSIWKEEAREGDRVPALALLQALISCLTLKNVFFLSWVSSCIAAAAGLGGWVKGLRNDSESFPAEKFCDSAVTSLSN